MYGNEAEIGKALDKHLKSGSVKREELFVTTKLPNKAAEKSKDGVEPTIRECLKKLQLDYVDLVLIHWPVTDRPGKQPGDLDPPAQASTLAMLCCAPCSFMQTLWTMLPCLSCMQLS